MENQIGMVAGSRSAGPHQEVGLLVAVLGLLRQRDHRATWHFT